MAACSGCNGEGYVACFHCGTEGMDPCDLCDGFGEVDDEEDTEKETVNDTK